MENRKFCPLMSDSTTYRVYCSDECGWYNKTDGCCSMVVLSNSAINVAEMATGQRIIYTKEV